MAGRSGNSRRTFSSLLLPHKAGTISDTGTLTIGTTPSVAAGTFSLGGVISGGTVSVAHGATFLSYGGGLAGTTYDGPLTLGACHESLALAGASTLTGTAGTGAGTGRGTMLTLGSAYIVHQVGDDADIILEDPADTLVNSGTIKASLADGVFDIGNSTTTGTISNLGSIIVTNGEAVTIAAGSFVNKGKISVGGTGSVLDFTGVVTMTSLNGISVTGGGMVEIANTLLNGGTLTIGAGVTLSEIELAGTISGGAISDAGCGLIASIADDTGRSATLTLGTGYTVNQADFFANIILDDVADTLVNSGSINAPFSGGQLRRELQAGFVPFSACLMTASAGEMSSPASRFCTVLDHETGRNSHLTFASQAARPCGSWMTSRISR